MLGVCGVVASSDLGNKSECRQKSPHWERDSLMGCNVLNSMWGGGADPPFGNVTLVWTSGEKGGGGVGRQLELNGALVCTVLTEGHSNTNCTELHLLYPPHSSLVWVILFLLLECRGGLSPFTEDHVVIKDYKIQPHPHSIHKSIQKGLCGQ